ncbi:MAG: hypothetical protein IPK99_02325 [Flavobacteriales bacterium]|nr:hypothetical protein [Flavobacteriales bacterium]
MDEFNGEFTSAAVRDLADTYRRWLDMGYLAIGLAFMLNIVDATVDALRAVRCGRGILFKASPSLQLASRVAPLE